jgi:hypothetical protein
MELLLLLQLTQVTPSNEYRIKYHWNNYDVILDSTIVAWFKGKGLEWQLNVGYARGKWAYGYNVTTGTSGSGSGVGIGEHRETFKTLGECIADASVFLHACAIRMCGTNATATKELEKSRLYFLAGDYFSGKLGAFEELPRERIDYFTMKDPKTGSIRYIESPRLFNQTIHTD